MLCLLFDLQTGPRVKKRAYEQWLFTFFAAGSPNYTFGWPVFRGKHFKDNFHEVETAIQSATFLAINCRGDRPYMSSSSPKQSYESWSTPSLLFSLGWVFSTFRKRHSIRTVNFHLFPRQTIWNAPDVRFSCRCSSLHFSNSHVFDAMEQVNSKGMDTMPAACWQAATWGVDARAALPVPPVSAAAEFLSSSGEGGAVQATWRSTFQV